MDINRTRVGWRPAVKREAFPRDAAWAPVPQALVAGIPSALTENFGCGWLPVHAANVTHASLAAGARAVGILPKLLILDAPPYQPPCLPPCQ